MKILDMEIVEFTTEYFEAYKAWFADRFLEFVTLLWSVICASQNFWAVLGHQDCVFKLRGQASVFGSYGPAISLIANRMLRTTINHRFDREAHSWVKSFAFGLWAGDVWNVGALMKLCADAMANVFVDDAKSLVVIFHMGDNRFADD